MRFVSFADAVEDGCGGADANQHRFVGRTTAEPTTVTAPPLKDTEPTEPSFPSLTPWIPTDDPVCSLEAQLLRSRRKLDRQARSHTEELRERKARFDDQIQALQMRLYDEDCCGGDHGLYRYAV